MLNKISFEKKNIPNILTIIRFIFTIVIVVLLLIPKSDIIIYTLLNPLNNSKLPYSNIDLNYFLAGIFFVIASLTDMIDGKLARKYNWISDFGKLWDPIADKVLINSVLICFGFLKLVPIWIPIIMIARDIIVDASRMLAATKNIVVAANFYGKMKTVTQMIAIILIFFLFANNFTTSTDSIMYWVIQNVMMYVALFFSLLSGLIYIINIQKQIKKTRLQK